MKAFLQGNVVILSAGIGLLLIWLCSEKQYEKKLCMWKKQRIFKGKNTKCEYRNRMVRIRGTRAKIGKTTGFKFNDKPFSNAKLNLHIAVKKLNEADVIAEGHCSGGNSLLLMLLQVRVSG